MKIDNYIEFILENNEEFRLYYSDKFREILEKIADDYVADLLLKSESVSGIQDVYTLIDITDKNDKISLIQANRIQKKLLNNDMWGFAIDNHEGILPYSINRKSKGDKLWKDARTEFGIGKWGRRVVTKLFKKNLNEKELETFVNLYKSTYDERNNPNFQLAEGEEIRFWYDEDNYEFNKGQLGSSCMKHKYCQSYFDIYVKNPEVCKLLILKSGTKIKGRALIWKLRNGRYFQDRIYTNRDSDVILFENWAKEKNMLYYNNKPDGLYVKLGDFEYDYYPYMDSLMLYNYNTKILSDDESVWPERGYYLLQETEGTFKGDTLVYADYIDDYIEEEDAIEIEGEYYYRDDCIYLPYKDKWCITDNVMYSDHFDEGFDKDDCVYSELMSDYLPTSNEIPESKEVIKVIRSLKTGSSDYCVKVRTDLYTEVEKGVYYLKENYFLDPFTNEYHFRDDEYEGFKFEDYLFNKISKLFGGSIKGFNEKVYDIFREGDYNRELLIEDIEKLDEFTVNIKKVYWGLERESLPTVEDVIPFVFVNLVNHGNDIIGEVLKIDPSLKDKLDRWRYERRIVNRLMLIGEYLDPTKYGKKFYLAYLLFKM